MIFASDGLWNVIDADFSVDSVYDTERQNDHNAKLGINTWRNPSRVLVETALEKWRSNFMRADNTSVVCVMLDPPNKRNLFKFCRSPTDTDFETSIESQEGARTIFDYSTSEAYNLDYMSSDVYESGNQAHQNALNNLYSEDGKFYEQLNSRNYQYPGSPQTSYNSFENSYGYQMASTSTQGQQFNPALPGSLTYQATNNESAFVKACCRNNYTLAGANEQIPYHSTYEQHRQMYENMALRPYPPLHYAYRPVPNPSHQLPLPSLHTNVYDHQGYLQNSHNYQPMKRFNYLRPTPEELAAIHNEEDDDDSDTMEFSDEESDEEESTKEEPKESTSTAIENGNLSNENRDDSIQIFEISSSSFTEKCIHDDQDNSNDEAEKPVKSNNKENTENASRKKKVPATSGGRFYATRQTDRKMRSGNVGTTLRSIGREKSMRKATKAMKKVAKTLTDQKVSSANMKTLPEMTRGSVKKAAVKSDESNTDSKETKKRVLRSAPIKEPETVTLKRLNDKTKVIRSIRSKQSIVMSKPATRKRLSQALLDNVERGRERRIK